MKKYLLILFIGISISSLKAQETTPDDALRLAVDNLTGTARFRSMSGAFGAVGGDLSAINVNPAGSIFFNNNYGTITANIFGIRNNSTYFGTNTSSRDNTVDINQIGTVFIFKNTDPNSDWKKFSIALNYDGTNNYQNSIYSAGVNPTNSIGNYFLNFAQGVPLNTLKNKDFYQLGFTDQQAYLGYNTYIFDPQSTDTNNTQYYTNVASGGNYTQQNQVASSGYSGKMTANFSTSFKNKLFFGGNLNVHFVDIRKSFSVYETNNNAPYPTGSTITRILFDNQLTTTGSGFSFNLGAIIKPVDNMRLGLAYESPTWYNLSDELAQGVATHSVNNPDNNSAPKIYPYSTIFAPYTIKTPSKWTGSFAYIFNKKGLISFDISSKDYANTQFHPVNDPTYIGLNNYMATALTRSLEYRIGGEYKIDQVSLRAGYRFEESPYKSIQTYGDLTGYSGGIGFNFGDSRLDIAYSHDHRNSNQPFLSSGMTDAARISTCRNYFTVSYSINF